MSDDTELTPEQMRELLMKDNQKRILDCNEELQELLKKHNCRLEADFTINWNGSVMPRLIILANEE